MKRFFMGIKFKNRIKKLREIFEIMSINNFRKEKIKNMAGVSLINKFKENVITVSAYIVPSAESMSSRIFFYSSHILIVVGVLFIMSSHIPKTAHRSYATYSKKLLPLPSFRDEAIRADIMRDENINLTQQENKKPDTSILTSYHRIISNKSRKYKIDQSLVYAMIKVESNWNIKAVSDKGATGLMQLMPSTARAMAVKNPRNPEENIEGGIRYLRYLLDRFDGDIALALAAYNAGPGRVEKYRGIPPITETQLYVEKVLSIYHGKNPFDKLKPPQI
jgi:hypothetical protein